MSIFSRKEMNTDNVMQIVNTCVSNLVEEAEFVKQFLISMGKTTKFNLVLKMLTKSEKTSRILI